MATMTPTHIHWIVKSGFDTRIIIGLMVWLENSHKRGLLRADRSSLIVYFFLLSDFIF